MECDKLQVSCSKPMGKKGSMLSVRKVDCSGNCKLTVGDLVFTSKRSEVIEGPNARVLLRGDIVVCLEKTKMSCEECVIRSDGPDWVLAGEFEFGTGGEMDVVKALTNCQSNP